MSLIVDDGRIAERGTHEGLMRARRAYCRLVRDQLHASEVAPEEAGGQAPLVALLARSVALGER